MTRIRLQFSATRFPRFLAAYKKALAANPEFADSLAASFSFCSDRNQVVVSLCSGDTIFLHLDCIKLSYLSCGYIILPRFNCRVRRVYVSF